jgi:hypothetical protein
MNEKAAYLAGIIDGEGTVYAQRIRSGFNIRVYVVSTDVRLIRWLEQNFGGLVYSRQSKLHPEWKTKWEWVVDKAGTTKVLSLVLPYLIIKREQAELGLALRHDIEARKGRNIDKAYRTELCEKISFLNQRGWLATTTKPSGPETVCDSLNCNDDKVAEVEETATRLQ